LFHPIFNLGSQLKLGDAGLYGRNYVSHDDTYELRRLAHNCQLLGILDGAQPFHGVATAHPSYAGAGGILEGRSLSDSDLRGGKSNTQPAAPPA
jgi:hypothetical protein